MNQSEIIQIVKHNLKEVNKLSRNLLENFEFEVIDEFRIEVKKLRAFLRLIRWNPTAAQELTLPFRIKSFYGYVGIIRNVRMQLNVIHHYAEEHKVAVPRHYISILEHDENYWRAEAIEAFDGNDFYDDEHKILAGLPDKLLTEVLEEYSTEYYQEISRLALGKHSADDEDLNKLRKMLSDVLYNWPYVKGHFHPLPCFASEQEMTLVHTFLNSLRDVSISLHFLPDAYLLDPGNASEVFLLKKVQTQLAARKRMLRHEIMTLLSERDDDQRLKEATGVFTH